MQAFLKKLYMAGDFWGGFAAMLVALPSSVAFGVATYSVFGPQFAAQGAIAGVIGAARLVFHSIDGDKISEKYG